MDSLPPALGACYFLTIVAPVTMDIFIVPYNTIFDSMNLTLKMTTTSTSFIPVNIIFADMVTEDQLSYKQPAEVEISTRQSRDTIDRIIVHSQGQITLTVIITDSRAQVRIFPVMLFKDLGKRYFLPPLDWHNASMAMTTLLEGNTVIAIAVAETSGWLEYDNRVYSHGQVLTIFLGENQTEHINITGDVTGSFIIASQPIAVVVVNDVISSHNSTSVISDMLYPYGSWDTEFALMPLNTKTDNISILGGLTGASIDISSFNETISLAAQASVNIVIDTPIYINSSQPIFICRHVGLENDILDSWVVEGRARGRNHYVLAPPGMTSSENVIITTLTSSTTHVVVSDRPSENIEWTPIPGSNLSFASFSFNEHVIYVGHSNCSTKIHVQVFGYQVYENETSIYGYPAEIGMDSERNESTTSCELPINEEEFSTIIGYSRSQTIDATHITSYVTLQTSADFSIDSSFSPSLSVSFLTTPVIDLPSQMYIISPLSTMTIDIHISASPTMQESDPAYDDHLSTVWPSSKIASPPQIQQNYIQDLLKLLSTIAVPPICLAGVGMVVWVGIKRLRSSAVLKVTGAKKTRRIRVSTVKITPQNSPRINAPRAYASRKQTTVTSLRPPSSNLDF